MRIIGTEQYVLQSLDSFLKNPPDSDFQRGYMAALLNVASEGLGLMNTIMAHEALLARSIQEAKHNARRREIVEGDS